MKKTYKYLIYLFVLLGILISFEKLYHYLILQNLNLKQSYVLQEKINADILIQGNCVPYSTMSPEILTKETSLKTYNLAEHNADYVENYLALNLYLQNNKAPKYLILFASPETFDDRYNLFNSYRYSNYMENEAVRKTIKHLDPSYYKWTFVPFMRYSYYSNQFNFNAVQGAKHIQEKRKKPYLANGFNPFLKYDYRMSYKKGKYFNWSKTKELYLIKLLKLAHKNKIKVFMYESPIYPKEAKLQLNRTEILSKIRSTASSYNVDYLVFDTMKLANDRDHFASTNRLNRENAVIFDHVFCEVFKKRMK